MTMGSIRHHELGEIYHLGTKHQPKGVWVVFGGQAGSEGKGAISAYLAQRYQWGATVSNFMPNAGHTYRDNDGNKVVLSHLSMGALFPNAGWVVIGAGSVINVPALKEEIRKIETDMNVSVQDRLLVHPRAMVVQESHREWEQENLVYISSTCKGSGAALADKIRRVEGIHLARDDQWLKQFTMVDTTEVLNGLVNGGKGVLIEGSQGFELDINHGISYPYCTSRQCTPAQLVADAGLEGRLVTRSIAVVRTFPIRVGNVQDEEGKRIGYSGEYGTEEVSWSELDVKPETTTVTGKTRRVFRLDLDGLKRMSMICRPTEIALTFADYVDKNIAGLTDERFLNEFGSDLMKASPAVHRLIWRVENAVHRPTSLCKVALIKTGPNDNQTLPVAI